MDDNYEVTYSPATLTIEKCPVRVSGITVSDKTFDGTKEVKSINISGAVFTPLYTNALTGKADKLSLDASKISAVFTDERAGTGVAADITIAANAVPPKEKSIIKVIMVVRHPLITVLLFIL